MIGLKGARVIVVDDEEEHALPILKVLAREGIPAAFFEGTIRGLPLKNHRLTGVRLAILDMDLVGGGASDKSKVATLVNFISKLLSPRNGPYGVLVWTQHPELKDEFENALFSTADVARPIFSAMIVKADYIDPKGKFNLTRLREKVQEHLAQFSPLALFQAWEEESFKAATEVTNALSQIATSDSPNIETWRNNWKRKLLLLMKAMADAEAGKHLDSATCLSALYSSLNPLHADRMESNAANMSGSTSYGSEIVEAAGHCDHEARAKINTMLHLAFENQDKFYAGNIYLSKSKRNSGWIPAKTSLLGDLTNNPSSDDVRIDLSRVAIPVAIEISPVCDHSQKNIRAARFIAGLLIPSEKRNLMKHKTGFIWEFGPLYLDVNYPKRGEYCMYLSARHLTTLAPKHASTLTAFARLRGEALADLQAWLAHHASRPGMLIL